MLLDILARIEAEMKQIEQAKQPQIEAPVVAAE